MPKPKKTAKVTIDRKLDFDERFWPAIDNFKRMSEKAITKTATEMVETMFGIGDNLEEGDRRPDLDFVVENSKQQKGFFLRVFFCHLDYRFMDFDLNQIWLNSGWDNEIDELERHPDEVKRLQPIIQAFRDMADNMEAKMHQKLNKKKGK